MNYRQGDLPLGTLFSQAGQLPCISPGLFCTFSSLPETIVVLFSLRVGQARSADHYRVPVRLQFRSSLLCTVFALATTNRFSSARCLAATLSNAAGPGGKEIMRSRRTHPSGRGWGESLFLLQLEGRPDLIQALAVATKGQRPSNLAFADVRCRASTVAEESSFIHGIIGSHLDRHDEL